MNFNVFLINIELWVHKLVIIETGHIDARFKHEEIKYNFLYAHTYSVVRF